MTSVLIIDDEASFSAGVAEYLELRGHQSEVAATLAEARRKLKRVEPTLVLLDLMLPDGSGLELLQELARAQPVHIVIMSGHDGVKSLIGSMAGKNVRFMKKPLDLRELASLLRGLEPEDARPVPDSDDAETFGLLVGASEAMRELCEQIRRVAVTDSTVFLEGESGTGKELVAEAIHRVSERSGRFVPVNCGSLATDLVSSQLFGHEKGSFTGANQAHAGFFEQAEGGTLFLDEITEMPVDMQAHLLRALETATVRRLGSERDLPVNCRVIAATNRDAAQAVRDGQLREDLYFRLRVFPLRMPPLRERSDDVHLLADHFLAELNHRHATQKRLSGKAMERLERHTWPGNVRELKHLVHRAYILAEGDEIEVSERMLDQDVPGQVKGLTVGRSIADVEKDLILTTLEHYGGSKKEAAATLGISLKTLYNRLRDYESLD